METTISFANWDVFWYTRGFPSMNTERSRRHSSKLLTYPMTIGSVLHQFSGLTFNNQRLTSEGSRSLAGMVRHYPSFFLMLTLLPQPSGPLCTLSQEHPRRRSLELTNLKSVYSFLAPERNPLCRRMFGNSYACFSRPHCCISTSLDRKFHFRNLLMI